VRHVHKIKLSDLRGIDRQIERVEQNARQFIEGKPANNVLLTGARGTGKSSIVKGLLNKYSRQGLRLIEVEKNDLVDLPTSSTWWRRARSASSSSATTLRSTAPKTGTSRSRWRSTVPFPPPPTTCSSAPRRTGAT
jgi:ribosome biogenesis GTPase A